MEKKKTEFRDKDFVLMCAFDYVIFRKTYAPKMILDEIKLSWGSLNATTKQYFKRQVELNKKDCNKCLLEILEL